MGSTTSVEGEQGLTRVNPRSGSPHQTSSRPVSKDSPKQSRPQQDQVPALTARSAAPAPAPTQDQGGLRPVTYQARLTVNDFDLLKVVGKGSFGKVMQVRMKQDGKIYAMKVLKKAALYARKQVTHTQTERKVLSEVDHPFIVSLRFAFQTKAKLYMILDYFNGGELFFHLKKDGSFSETRSQFYGAEIVSALECLHAKSIVYRDLKPENILLDADGHIKITDFGLSKESIDSDTLTHTFCGTPEYLAPEVLEGVGHGKAVDWWSFGTLLYEMMTGLPPFYDSNVNVMYDKILHQRLELPDTLSGVAKHFFKKLLERDPDVRLGSGATGTEKVKTHPFFKGIDWEKLVRKEVTPPFKPDVADEVDVSQVDEEFTIETPRDTPVVAASHIARNAAFPGFTFVGGRNI